MVNIETSFERIKKLTSRKLTIEELEKILSNMGMELAGIEGDIIKIEITAERIDMLTPEGIARAINCYAGYTKKYEEIKVNKSEYVHKVDPIVKKYRPYTRSFIVKGLKFSDEDIKTLMWIQEKIHDTYGRKRKKLALGVYDLDKIQFPITYTMSKPAEIKFIPLGMQEQLNATQILQKHPTGRDYAHLLEDYDKYPIQIDSKKQILSLPPIINSNDLGKIETKTKNIFIESTGSSEEALDKVSIILATMFNDWGGKIYEITIEDGKNKIKCPNIQPRTKTVSAAFINKWIGLSLSSKEIGKLLEKMEFTITRIDRDNITLTVPNVRADVWHDVDLADDVARAFGYNNIKPTLPNIPSIGEMLPINILKEDLCNFLTGFDLIEIKTFSLTNVKDQYEKMNIPEQEHISLGKNTQDKNLNMIRTWLIPEAIKALVANRNKEYPQKVYEADIVIIPDSKADVRSKNTEHLACLLCEEKTDFTKSKQLLDAIFEFLGLEYKIREKYHTSFIEGRCGVILIKEKEIGIIGEIHPQVIENWQLQMPIAAFEIDLNEILKNL